MSSDMPVASNPQPEEKPQSRLSLSQRLGILCSLIFVALILAANVAQAPAWKTLTTLNEVELLATPTPSHAERIAHWERQQILARANLDTSALILALEKSLNLQPENDTILRELAGLYYTEGMQTRDKGRFEEAYHRFGQVLELRPEFDLASSEQYLANVYLVGLDHYRAGRWDEALARFEEIYYQAPTYPTLDQLLYRLYRNQALILQQAGDLSAALILFQQAARMHPSDTWVAEQVQSLAVKLNPPPLPKKRVIVDISEQMTYLFEDDEVVQAFVTSTGEPGRDTAPGYFKILNKIPNAYASTWNLDMPYWLGVYWVGSYQNGFHGPPTKRDTGYTLWEGFLGQRVSYGCIILSMADIRFLYGWADIGTEVRIRY